MKPEGVATLVSCRLEQAQTALNDAKYLKAFELRQVSHYKVSQLLTREKAAEALGNATRFVEAIREHLSESPAP